MYKEKYDRRVTSGQHGEGTLQPSGVDDSPIFNTRSTVQLLLGHDVFREVQMASRSLRLEPSVVLEIQQLMNDHFRLEVELKNDDNIVSQIENTSQQFERMALPDYLTQSIDGATSFNILDLLLDVRIGLSSLASQIYRILGLNKLSDRCEKMRMDEHDPGHILVSAQEAYLNQFRMARADILSIDGRTENDVMLDMWEGYNRSEAKKSMILFGVPFTYHMLMEDRHSRYPDRETVMSEIDNSFLGSIFSLVAASYIKVYGPARALGPADVKLPIGTSQGIILRGSKDTPVTKAYYKFLLALYASKCKSRSELNEMLDGIDAQFNARGFDSVSRHAMLGLRKMHISRKKNEPLFDHGDQSSVHSFSKQTQGRVRAIFPFTEALKYWVKAYAEPIKSTLFHDKGCFGVDPLVIESAQRKVTSAFLRSKELIKHYQETGECLVAYDLHECDRTFHWQMNEHYVEKFLKKVLVDGDRIVGEHHNDGGVIAIRGVRGFRKRRAVGSCFIDHVNGCSTLSGQADVTLKNNVVHFCLIIHSIARALELRGDETQQLVEHLLRDGESKLRDRDIILHLHGDDVFLYLGEDPITYQRFNKELNATGASSGYEDGIVYLKKMWVERINSEGLSNITGSLLKNRLGEYPQLTPITLLLSLCDAVRTTHRINHRHSLIFRRCLREELLCLMTFLKTGHAYITDEELKSEVDDLVGSCKLLLELCAESVPFDSTDAIAKIDNIVRTVSIKLSVVLDKNTPKAIAIRRSLLTDSYKLNTKSELVSEVVDAIDEAYDTDADIDSLATYSIDPLTVSNRLAIDETVVGKLMKMSRVDLLQLITSLQSELLDQDGMVDGQLYLKRYIS